MLSPKSKYKRSKYVLSITCIAFITVNFFTKLPSKLKISRSGNHEAVCKCTCILNWMVLRKHGQRSRSGRLKLHPRPIHDPSRFEEVISLHCHFSHGSDSQTFYERICLKTRNTRTGGGIVKKRGEYFVSNLPHPRVIPSTGVPDRGWSQKTTLHHVIMMGETFSRQIYTSFSLLLRHRIICWPGHKSFCFQSIQ